MAYNVPCKDCDKKGCGTYHDKCEKYLKYRKLKEKEYEARRGITRKGVIK